MPRLGDKVNRYRPSDDLLLLDGKTYDLRQDVTAHFGFERQASASGKVDDLTGNGRIADLQHGAIVRVSNYPGVLSRGSLFFNPAHPSSGLENKLSIPNNRVLSPLKQFSVSFWLKLSDATFTGQILAYVNNSFQIRYDTVRTISLRMFERTAPTYYMNFGTQLPSSFDLTQWTHIVITNPGIDGAGQDEVGLFDSMFAAFQDNLIDSGPQIYVNGSHSLGNPVGSYSFSATPEWKGFTENSNNFIVRVNDGATFDIPVRSFGSIEWWSRALTEDEANAIYHAQIEEYSSIAFNRSGFISRSPRLHLREIDDLPGAYPTVRRTGDSTRTGALVSNFNDETSIVFSASEAVTLPSMLPAGSSFESQAVDIVGQESDISVSLPIRSFQHPTHLHYSPTEAVGPFDENRVAPATDFFLSGTNPDVLPGFASPLRSKIAIEIDITPQNEMTLTRNVSARNTAESQPVSSDNTGFCYYNFDENKWEQIGLRDPATGDSLYYDFAISSVTGEISGTFPNQFTFGNSSAKEQDDLESEGDVRSELGYSRIGSPTLVMGAPSLTKYHATSSQALKLSGFISDPFMLEAVSVDFGEIRAQRVNGGAVAISNATTFKSGSLRDIDNYVFFMYRQSRANRVVDSISDVSSSSRYLICSASMTFWNSASLSGSSWSPATLLHAPAFSYEFGLPYNDTYQVASFTGSVYLNLRPAICGPSQLGVSRVPQIDGTGTRLIQNSWGGGSTLQSVTLFSDGGSIRPFDKDAGETLTNVIDRAAKIDSRPLRKFGGETQDQLTENLFGFGFVSANSAQSNESPYVLLPEDEIVLGLEAGIPQLPFAGLVSNLTGSHLKVGTKPCKIVLYGSLIKNNEEILPNLNQDLSSNSIHEIVGAAPQLDQFQIEPMSSYYGSYLDEIVTGSMANPTLGGFVFDTTDQDNSRRVISRVSEGQAGTTGSLQRFIKISDASERTYDSCLPSYVEMLSLQSDLSEYTYKGVGTRRFTGGTFASVYENEDLSQSAVKQFPFAGNPIRNLEREPGILQAGADISSDPINITGEILNPLNFVYMTRYLFDATGSSQYLPQYANWVKPIGSSASFDLHSKLDSSYFMTSSDSGTLFDMSGNGADMDMTPDFGSGDHPAPANSTSVPVPNLLNDGSLTFAAAGTAANVNVIAYQGTNAAQHNLIKLTDDSKFSISATIKTGTGLPDRVILERAARTGANRARQYRLMITSGNLIEFTLYHNGTSNSKGITSSTVLAADTWYNIVVTYDGDKTQGIGSSCCKMYVNGVEEISLSSTNSASPALANGAAGLYKLWIGAGWDGGSTGEPAAINEFTGEIHSVHIWRERQITADEASAISIAELTGTSYGLIMHRSSRDDYNSPDLEKRPLKNGTYRYGISNINPEFSAARWRYDRYGQHRDMLEPRLLAARFDGFNPVKARFMSGSKVLPDPTETHTQNISTFATSSMPYFDDGIARNRDDNPDETLLNV